MAKFVTLRDVAEKAGTTVGTVSYVLNDRKGRYISQELRAKVLAAAEELHYIKCNGASSLKGMDRKLIGILIPQYENQFFTRICVAAEEVFASYGYDLIICDTFDNPEREKIIIHRLLSQRVDGLIVTPSLKGSENTRIVRDVGLTMVVVDRPLEGFNDYYWVSADNYGCGYVGGENLRKHGHRSLIYVGWDSGISELSERERGFRDACKDCEVFTYNAEFSPKACYEVTMKAVKEHPEATAVLFGFNVQAQGGVNVFRDLGMKIGEDISVSLIGSPEWSYTGNNNFTHVHMGDYEIGKKAAGILFDLIRGNAVPSKRVIQECTLVEGSSVGNIGGGIE